MQKQWPDYRQGLCTHIYLSILSLFSALVPVQKNKSKSKADRQMITLDKHTCSGCTACFAVCPGNAIGMEPDNLGFLYPVIDKAKCIQCGACEKVCAFNAHYETENNFAVPLVYAARHKDIAEVELSRSGGMFAALSDKILEEGGVVYGAGFQDHFRVVHKRALSKKERDGMRGAKYVQSDMRGIYTQVKSDLTGNKTVLFSGTPCQTAGLDSFLKYTHAPVENLYLCDIVCHSVPSPYIWRDYVGYIEKKQKQKILSADFRDKAKFGWSDNQETFVFNKRRKTTETYNYLFIRRIMLRHACGNCPFTNFRRPADITLGDFWGWEKVDRNFNADNKGVSLVLINTPKGLRLFNLVKENINYIESNTHDCLQSSLQRTITPHRYRDTFEEDYKTHGFEYVLKRYGDVTLRAKIKILLLNILSFCKGKIK
jgi:ferredoxin